MELRWWWLPTRTGNRVRDRGVGLKMDVVSKILVDPLGFNLLGSAQPHWTSFVDRFHAHPPLLYAATGAAASALASATHVFLAATSSPKRDRPAPTPPSSYDPRGVKHEEL